MRASPIWTGHLRFMIMDFLDDLLYLAIENLRNFIAPPKRTEQPGPVMASHTPIDHKAAAELKVQVGAMN
jgi:hypothetical protein